MSNTLLISRRNFLIIIASLWLMPRKAFAAIWNSAAFETKVVDEATKSLNMPKATPTDQLEITLPSRAENGAIVQLEVISHLPQTNALAVLVPNNPTALIAYIAFSGGALPRLVTRIKMAETSAVKVVAKTAENYFEAAKTVEVLENGCGGSSSNEKFESSIKMRAKRLPASNGAAITPENIAELKAIITHPMHTGYAKDEAGNIVPALFIQLVTITLNDQVVIEMQLGTGISKNPYFTFQIANAKLNDIVKLVWSDNRGNTGKGETQIIN